MTAVLSWVDRDEAARQRMQQVLALFRAKETRDELGIGGIRDSIGDLLFPGTNTIQTRLRYMLMVPWVYQALEAKRVPSVSVAGKARSLELQLSDVLKEDGDFEGVFGWVAGHGLKRLPSSVYWAPLGSWGIRRFDGSQDEYHRSLDAIYQRRRVSGQTEEGLLELFSTWDPGLPPAPAGFPADQSCRLSSEEAAYLYDRIVISHPSSFLATVVSSRKRSALKVPYPWLYTGSSLVPKEQQEVLHHGRLFSEVMHGAAICYNILLAQVAGREQLIVDLSAELSRWAENTDWTSVGTWDLNRFWAIVSGRGHQITGHARSFVEQWTGLALAASASPESLAANAGGLIRNRETWLKRSRSRFTNQRSLEQWGGRAGLSRMDYRWSTVARMLDDLFAGLGAR